MKTKLLFLCLIVSPIMVFSQKYKVTSGDYSALVGVKEFNVQMDYSEVKYYKENMSEEKYVQKRISDKDGDDVAEIKAEWQKTKDTRIPDKVLSIANKYSKGNEYSMDNESAKVTMIVTPQWIYPGWFGGVMKQPSKLNVNYVFVETANPSNVLLTITCTKAVGDIYPIGIPNTNQRIAEAFAHSGKGLAKLLSKKVK